MEKMKKITLALGHQKLEQTIMNTIKDEYFYTDVVTRKGLLYITVKEDMPDIVIVNNELPGEDNETLYDVLYRIRADFPEVRIILLMKVEEGEYSSLEPFIQIGIYDIWTKSNIRIDALIDFIKNPLNFGDWASKIDKSNMKTSNLNIEPVPQKENETSPKYTPQHILEESASGFLKIKKQENKKANDSKKIVVPTFVKNSGFVSGRPKRNPIKQEQALKDNTPKAIPDIERKQADFSIDVSLQKEQVVSATKPEITPIQKEVVKPRSINPVQVDKREVVEKTTRVERNESQNIVKPPIKTGVKPIQVKTEAKPVKVFENEHVSKPRQVRPEIKMPSVSNNKPVVKAPVVKNTDNSEEIIVPQKKHKPTPGITGGLLKGNRQSNANKPLVNREVKILTTEEREALKKANNIKTAPNRVVVEKKIEHIEVPKANSVKKDDIHREKNIRQSHPVTDKRVNKEIIENKPVVTSKRIPEKMNRHKNRDCNTILFAQSERHSMSHTGLNLAIVLAKKGFQVAYISTFSASDDLFIKYTPIQIYDKFNVKQGTLVEEIPTLAILKYDISKSFELLEKIKEENEVDYLIFNTDIKDDFEKIMILADKSYILLEQNPVIFAKLNKSYKHLFKYMNVVVESFHSKRDSCEDILGYTKCKKIIKLANTDTMNYEAIKKHRPLALDNEDIADDFEQLLSETE